MDATSAKDAIQWRDCPALPSNARDLTAPQRRKSALSPMHVTDAVRNAVDACLLEVADMYPAF